MAIANSWSTTSDVVNTVLAQEANRIGSDVHKRLLHTSPWIDLIKKSAFPEGMGSKLTSLVYDRALPANSAGTSLINSSSWIDMGAFQTGSNSFDTSKIQGAQSLVDAGIDTADPATGRGYISVSKQLKQYSIKKIALESPKMSIEDMRFAAHRTEQLRAVIDLLTSASKNAWEDRYRREFDKLAGNIVPCLTTGTKLYDTIDLSASTKKTGTATADVDLNNDFDTSGTDVDKTPTANISNAILDKIYFQLVRKGAGNNAYGRENGRPVFGIVLSSEASYQLQTEAGFRDDVRYNSSAVGDLVAPLGVEKSFRGFYHLVDDLAPRFNAHASDGTVDEVSPYNIDAGVVTMNSDYDDANFEAAYIIHPEVFESLIPEPVSAGNGISFDPCSYKGDFKWTNIPDATDNPDGTIGFFRGVLASASKPIKTDFGYVVLFKRNSSTPAA